MRRRARSVAVIGAVIGFIIALAVVQPPPRARAELANCISSAIAAHESSWVCGPYPDDEANDVAPAGLPTQIGDWDDTWCANAGLCHQVRGQFVSKTRGNGGYGNGSGAIGSFTITLSTSLSGRQPRWRLSLTRTSGPPIQFVILHVGCWEDVSFLPDPSCGSLDPGGPLLTDRWRSSLLYGRRLADANEYYAVVNGQFAPAGHPVFTLGALQSRLSRALRETMDALSRRTPDHGWTPGPS
jgi:hypothetical protein